MKNFFIFCLTTILFASCNNSGERGRDQKTLSDTIVPTQGTGIVNPIINVYIENSGSMDGYVDGQTEFKGAIRDLLVMLKYHYDEKNIKIFFINSNVHSTAAEIDLATFAENINTLWYIGDRKHSKLNNIFKQVLERTNDQTISILFSDYIYSISGKNTASLLNDEKSLTKDVFLSKWKNDKVQLATAIVKMKSKFKGRYFPYTSDNDHFGIDMERPYYMCIIGKQEILNDFNQKIELKTGKIEGYENKYVLSSKDPKGIYYTVLQSTYNIGRFKPLRKESSAEYTRGIEKVKLTRNGEKLSFAVVVDFSSLQVEDDYISNPANYTVTTDNFDIVDIFPIVMKDIRGNDLKKIQASNPTHIIILAAKTKSVSDVSFVMKKQMPQWVYTSHTEDDTNPNPRTDKSPENLKEKTFGLKFWVEGITEAYETIYPDNKNYFECTISIK